MFEKAKNKLNEMKEESRIRAEERERIAQEKAEEEARIERERVQAEKDALMVFSEKEMLVELILFLREKSTLVSKLEDQQIYLKRSIDALDAKVSKLVSAFEKIDGN